MCYFIHKSGGIVNNAIIVIACLLLVLSFCGAICYSCSMKSNEDASAIWITAFIAIANALLLFATLRTQRNAIVSEKKTADQERFETTFFNLLQNNRALIPELQIDTITVYEDGNTPTTSFLYKGYDFFSAALVEIENLRSILTLSKLKPYDLNSFEGRENALQDEINNPNPDESKIANMRKVLAQDEYSGRMTSLYNLTDADLQEARTDPYHNIKVFKNRWGSIYERYLRNLIALLEFVNDSKQDIKKYSKFVYSQMSMNEYRFLKQLAFLEERLNNALH